MELDNPSEVRTDSSQVYLHSFHTYTTLRSDVLLIALLRSRTLASCTSHKQKPHTYCMLTRIERMLGS